MDRLDGLVRLFAAGHLLPGEETLVCCRGRLAGSGRIARERRWLVVTSDRVLVFSCTGWGVHPRALLGWVARAEVTGLPLAFSVAGTDRVETIVADDPDRVLWITAPDALLDVA